MRRSARNQSIPEDEAELLRALKGHALYRQVAEFYAHSWTLRAIGEVFDPPKSRSTMQSWVSQGSQLEQPPTFTVTEPTFATPATYTPVKLPSPGISQADKDRILHLSPIARRYRASMSPNHPAALAANELSDLCRSLVSQGVRISELAELSGVSHRAMSKRLSSNPR